MTTSSPPPPPAAAADDVAAAAAAGVAANGKQEAWLIYLTRKIELISTDTPEGVFHRALAVIVRDLLLRSISPAEAAVQIRGYCTTEVVNALHEKKARSGGVFTFRGTVNRSICYMGAVVPWRDERQGVLVELLLELRRLGEMWVKVRGEDHVIDFRNDLALTDVMDQFFYAYDPRELRTQYLNVAGFTARCLQHGMHEVFPPFPGNPCNHFWYIQNIISGNLNVQQHYDDDKYNNHVTKARNMAAAVYLCLAGDALFEHLVSMKSYHRA
ncbi:hypothetical protein KEM55_003691 [Ascosphaera atra]|nr:hypothetical protein KEM55_003691 [Ascosphaera atra]